MSAVSLATVFQEVEQAVLSDMGPARLWHRSNWIAHRERYRADLAILSTLAVPGMLLEVGAAPCHMTALLSRSGYRVVGVDIRPDRVAGFIERTAVDVRRCDIEREALPFADGTFSGALLCDVFEHLRIDPAFVLCEINRVLSLNGFLLLTTPNLYSLPSMARYALGKSLADPLTEYGKLRGLGHMGHVREYSSREVLRFLGSFGFTVDRSDFRFEPNDRSRRQRLLTLMYRVVPRRFRRDIVILARKAARGPVLQPLA